MFTVKLLTLRIYAYTLLPMVTLLSATIPISAQTVSTLVSVTPCRIMDTRFSTGAFGPPALVANGTREIPVPTSSCGIPSNALAYSLNVTVVPHERFDYLTLWPTGQAMPLASTLNGYSGTVTANAAIVPTGANGSISVFVTGSTELIIDINGYFAAQQITVPSIPSVIAQSASATSQNTAIGSGTSSTGGAQNTALGSNALAANNDGLANTAIGAGALASHSSGNNNTAIGTNAMSNSSSGYNDSVLGSHALESNASGHDNTAVGYAALQSNVLGQSNTAIGSNALFSNTGGIRNIGIGLNAGMNLTIGSDNIDIANDGVSGESGVVRIGTDGLQNSIYVAAVAGNQAPAGTAVYISSTGKLGVASSSRRYKEDIQDIGDISSNLSKLRPVQFRYKQASEDGSKPPQYGLIAEEVAAVYPQLVTHNQHGEIEGVQYQQLPALLLNELQKQARTISRQQEAIEKLTVRLQALESQIPAQTAATEFHEKQ